MGRKEKKTIAITGILFIGAVLAAVILGGRSGFLWRTGLYGTVSPAPEPPKVSSENRLQTLIVIAQKLNIPEIAQQSSLVPGKLPEKLAPIIPAGAKTVEMSSVIYEGGSDGYVISMLVPLDLDTVAKNYYYLFKNSTGGEWKIVSGARIPMTAAFREVESRLHRAIIEMNAVDEQNTNIRIRVLNL